MTTAATMSVSDFLMALSQGQLPKGAVVEIELSKNRARCRVRDTGALACALDAVEVWSQTGRGGNTSALRQRAQLLSNKMTYLLEPICVHEHDNAAATVQLRSAPPTRDSEQSVRYYELNMSADRIGLVRYEKRPNEVRQQIPMTVTHEVLCRILADLDQWLDVSDDGNTPRT